MAANKEIIHSINHFIVGFVLSLKGITKLSHHVVIGSIILLFGVIILGYFLYVVIKKHPSNSLSQTVHWFEALSCLFTAYILFEEGAKYLPYGFLLAAIGFFIAIYVTHKKESSSH